MLSDALNSQYPLVAIALVLLATVVALAASILYLRGFRPFARRPKERQWPGTPIDASRLNLPLRQVRGDFVKALRCRPHPRFHSQPLVEAARQAIMQLDYFQEKESSSLASDEVPPRLF